MRNPVRHRSRLWSIILAGGEGERVRPLIQAWLGYHKPKQYCSFIGTRSMFQHTLDRAVRLTRPERIMSVIARGHLQEALAQLEGRDAGTVLVQPKNCNTAAGIFLPLTFIRAQDASATVVIYPSDHFVYPEGRFLDVVQGALWTAERLPDRLVLLGVLPDRLELEYGWIHPGVQLVRSMGHQVRAVRAFIEKPNAAQADAALTAGALWNTLVLAAKVDTLWQVGWQCFPEMMPLFERLGLALGTSEEGRVLDAMYREMPQRNFSSDLLQRVPDQVAVIELSGVLWSDWGKPERITDTLRRMNKRPAFPLAYLTNPFTLTPHDTGEVA